MKSMMGKTTRREIKQSFGRFFAILAIVALGVGFFAGIKVAQSAMVVTTQEYYKKHQLFDYRLLSTMGFQNEEVAYLEGLPDTRAVKGAMSFDILYERGGGNEAVIRAHSLTEGINGVELLDGRLPQKPDECVVDSNLYTKEQIGQKVTLSAGNEEEDREKFAYGEYTITGIVNASYYIQFERGNTSLGTGQVSGFMYLQPEGFDVDYYTELFVKFDEDLPIYSADYDDYMDAGENRWKEYTKQAAENRYKRLVDDANDKLADAREELADKKADAEKKLADARETLNDADVKLQDGEQQMADAQKTLEDAQKTIKDKEKELSDGEAELTEQEKTLAEKEQELADGQKEWDDSNYVVESKKRELGESQQALNAQKELLEAQSQELTAGKEQLLQQESALNQQESDLKAIFGDILPEPYATAIAQGRQQMEAGKEQLAAGQAALDAGRETIAGYQAQLDAGGNALKDADKQLGTALQTLQDGREQLEDGRQKIADAKLQIEDGKKELEKARKEIADGKTKLQDKTKELEDAKTEYRDGLQEYNDSYADFQTQTAEAQTKIEDAQKDIDELEEPDTYVLGRETNVGYVCLDNDSGIVAGIANIFPVFFFLVAALVCITTMNRMVEEQRTQIGVLKALGYSEGAIMSKYLFYSGSAAFIGCIGGFIGGTYMLPRIIWTVYGIMYKVSRLIYVFDWKLAAISLFVSLLCSMGTTWLSCRYELAEVAAELMRPKAPKAGKRVLLEYITPVWKRLKFLQKVSVRNIFRYKKRFFMMIIGISGCTALLVTGFGIKDSISNVAVQQFGEIQVYDVGITLQDAVTQEDKEKLKTVLEGREDGITYVAEKAVDLVKNGKQKAINLLVVQEPDAIVSFLKFHTTDGVELPFPKTGEALISHKIADTYDIHVGDRVVLQDDEMRRMEVTISGINQNFVYDYIYMAPQTYADSIGEEAEFKSAFVNLAEDADAHQTAAALMKLSNVSATTVNDDIEERFTSMMSSLNYIVLVVIGCAAGLAFIVLYNLTNINITERIREIATIKVLGFYKRETASYVFRENMVLTLFGSGAGLILGYFLHRFVMSEIKVDMVAFDTHIEPLSYVLSIVLTFVFAWLVNTFMSRKLERINMAESLKSVD